MDKVEITRDLADYCLKVLGNKCAVVSHVVADPAVLHLRCRLEQLAVAVLKSEHAHLVMMDTGTAK